MLQEALHSYGSSFLLELRRTASWTLCLCLQNKHSHRLSMALSIPLSASFNLPPNFSISTLEILKFASLFMYLVHHSSVSTVIIAINPLNAELNPICHLLALLGGATIVVVSMLRFNCVLFYTNNLTLTYYSRSQWLGGLRRGYAAVRLLGLRVRFPLTVYMSVSCECCLLSDRGLCDGRSFVQRSPTECGVSQCAREASILGRIHMPPRAVEQRQKYT